MSEAWMLDLLAKARDAARSNAMFALAEHLDDAILLAASEFHAAEAVAVREMRALNERRGAEGLREFAGPALH